MTPATDERNDASNATVEALPVRDLTVVV